MMQPTTRLTNNTKIFFSTIETKSIQYEKQLFYHAPISSSKCYTTCCPGLSFNISLGTASLIAFFM